MKMQNAKLSDRVNLAMKRKGINKSKLKEMTQIAHGTIVAITNGERDNLNLNADTLYRLCKALDVTSDYLLGLTDTLSSSVELNSISDKIGLSPKSLENLISFKEMAEVNEGEEDLLNEFEVLDFILSDEYFETIIERIHDYFKNASFKWDTFYFDVDESQSRISFKDDTDSYEPSYLRIRGSAIDKGIMEEIEETLSYYRELSPYSNGVYERRKFKMISKEK